MIRRALSALRSLAGNGRPDDLCALIDATREPLPHPPEVAEWMGMAPVTAADFDWPVDYADECPTPLAHAAMRHLRDTLADWAAEVDALADIELAEMTREER